MARTRSIRADFGQRLPGRVRPGSPAALRKVTTKGARQGIAQVIQNYETIVRNLRNVTPAALRNAMAPVFHKSQVYVPKKTLALMASGRLDVFQGPGGAEASITYGDSEVWYASLVHEFVWLNHASPTRAKYLQAALEEELDAFLISLAVDYAQALG